MHILIVSHNYPYEEDPSFGFFCKQQAEALVLSGHRVGVICPLAYSIPKIIGRKKRFLFGRQTFTHNQVLANLFFFPSPPKLKALKYFVMERLGMAMLDKYVAEQGVPDILHMHVFYVGAIAAYARRRYGIPVVWTEHFSDIENGRLSKKEEKQLAQASEAASIRIAVSERFRDALERKLKVKFHYVPNVYDSKLFRYNGNRKPLKPFRFVHVANLNANKNQRRLISSFKLFGGNPEVQLSIIGDGEDFSSLKALIATAGLEAQVSLEGFRTAPEIFEEFQRSHAFVLSSDYETFGVSLIEAMACGLPCIATRAGGPESIITDPSLGILAEKNERSLSEAMKYVYENYEKYDPQQIATRALRFSYPQIGRELTELYQQCK